jgi:hypothetical protein
MYVSGHARARLDARLGTRVRLADAIVSRLEAMPGEPGTVAYLAAVLDKAWDTGDGSNGDLVFAVAVDGSVDTIYLRRKSQDCTARYFGARKVVRL